MKKKLFFFGLSLLNLSMLLAQTPSLKYKNQSISEFVKNEFGSRFQEDKLMDTTCIRGFTYLKFKVNEKGYIEELDCSNGTFPPLEYAIKFCLRETNG